MEYGWNAKNLQGLKRYILLMSHRKASNMIIDAYFYAYCTYLFGL